VTLVVSALALMALHGVVPIPGGELEWSSKERMVVSGFLALQMLWACSVVYRLRAQRPRRFRRKLSEKRAAAKKKAFEDA
jgi:hypothetical protein